MEDKHFHHALKFMEETCYGCSHCMRVCPTEAIRICNGKATLLENRCIDCGECYRVCPVSAIYVEQDDFNKIFNFKHRVAIVPSVLVGQFKSAIATEDIYATLIDIGFTHIYEIDNSVEIVIDQFHEYMKLKPEPRPLISCFCPAIVRLIQVRFPSLTENIIPIKPPIDIASHYYKKQLIDKGAAPEDIGLFYLTPCAAKIAAVKSPVGEDVSVIDGVINMDLIYNRILRHINTHKESAQRFIERDHVSSNGVQWSLTKGEANNMPGRCMAIDGMHNAIEFLEKIENDEITGIDFLEIRACDESCAGGILLSANRFTTVERIRKRAQNYHTDEIKQAKHKGINDYIEYLKQHIFVEKIRPRPIMKLDEDTQKALEKVQKVRKLMCFLPGFDCTACGSPSCQALAQDIVQGNAQLTHCVFMQKKMERNGKLSNDTAYNIIEKVWGKNRLEKNCNKKGAENESL